EARLSYLRVNGFGRIVCLFHVQPRARSICVPLFFFCLLNSVALRNQCFSYCAPLPPSPVAAPCSGLAPASFGRRARRSKMFFALNKVMREAVGSQAPLPRPHVHHLGLARLLKGTPGKFAPCGAPCLDGAGTRSAVVQLAGFFAQGAA